MDLIVPALGAIAGVGAWLLVVVQRRTTRRLVAEGDAMRAELEVVRATADAERRRIQTLLPEAAEAAWAARSLARAAARRDDEIAAQTAATLRREADGTARTAALTARVGELAADLDRASRASTIAGDRIVALETDLARSRVDAERNRIGAESAIAAARAEAAESARHAAEVRRQLADAAVALDEAHRSNGRLAQEATAAQDRQRSLEEDLERAAEALLQARELADEGRAAAGRLAAELDRVRHDADLRVAAALASIPTPPTPAPPPQPDARLVAQQAEIRDLEERLATLAAARNAEARRLGDRIASLERLHLEIGARDDRIVALESELKDSTEALESLRLETSHLDSRLRAAGVRLEEADRTVELAATLRSELAAARERVAVLESAVAGSARIGATEVEQLRAMLMAERERNVRLARRADLEPPLAMEAAVAAATRPLLGQIERLEAALASRPPRPPRGDDVTLIKGIGPKIAAILAAEGVTSIRQIAAFTAADISRIGALLPVYPGRIVADRWVEQARQLAVD